MIVSSLSMIFSIEKERKNLSSLICVKSSEEEHRSEEEEGKGKKKKINAIILKFIKAHIECVLHICSTVWTFVQLYFSPLQCDVIE